jgi:hypothetical protein
MSLLALQGAALFAVIPLVLFLYLRMPLGPGFSLALGVLLMLGHRFIAAPWMARNARRRCLWCGRSGTMPADMEQQLAGELPHPARPQSMGEVARPARVSRTLTAPLTVTAGGREWHLVTCRAAHRELAQRFLSFVASFRIPIALGIFVPLVVLIGGTFALALGHSIIPDEWNRFQFRTLVALTVVGTSIGYRAVPVPSGTLTCPFPLHNLFLLGIGKTLWVFRIVGAWWLVAGSLWLIATARQL